MRKNILKNSSGQSSVEFIISFIMVIGFVFMYVKVALNFTNGYLVHYGTFMASRAYMVYEGNSNTPSGSDNGARTIADEAWNSLNIDGLLKNITITREVNATGSVGSNLFVGIISTFQDRFSIFGNVGPTELIEFKSESFLGKETTIADCVERVCKAFSALGASCGNNTTVMDNGC